MSAPPPRLVFYADDFTGATDALEQLHRHGVRAALFTEPPTQEELAAAGSPEAVGVAGHTRSLATERIDAVVRPAFEAIRELGAAHYHYKVCSTFDSSPAIGSIGRVVEIGAEVFGASCVPVVVGSPALGRWVAFGNLFAGVGIGAESDVHRLDRHPVMRRHPVTPADEADLRVALGRQTALPIRTVDLRTLDADSTTVSGTLTERGSADPCEVVLFDTLSEVHLNKIGAALEASASPRRPLFSVGSSAVETALANAWSPRETAQTPATHGPPRPALVLVGSCSPVTAGQVAAARRAGVAAYELDSSEDEARLAESVGERLTRGESAMVTTGQFGDRNPRDNVQADALGHTFSRLVRSCRDALADGLLVVAGGDTASHTVRRLGVDWIEVETLFTIGAPICRAHSRRPMADGLRVLLKGGQVGDENLFIELTKPVAEASP